MALVIVWVLPHAVLQTLDLAGGSLFGRLSCKAQVSGDDEIRERERVMKDTKISEWPQSSLGLNPLESLREILGHWGVYSLTLPLTGSGWTRSVREFWLSYPSWLMQPSWLLLSPGMSAERGRCLRQKLVNIVEVVINLSDMWTWRYVERTKEK